MLGMLPKGFGSWSLLVFISWWYICSRNASFSYCQILLTLISMNFDLIGNKIAENTPPVKKMYYLLSF